MAAISFIAVQCFQCSTMQVKQQKRSNNKWVCVVCNERQSVRQVYARSHLAKDVRLFVQSFNMSRLADAAIGPDLIPPLPRLDEQNFSTGNRRKRMDWTEYLDREEPEKDEDGDGGSESEPKITTELPQKKRGRIFMKYTRVGRAGGDELQPISSKIRSEHCQGDTLSMKCQSIDKAKTESKWSEYLEECDEEEENNIYADGQLRSGLKFQFSDVQVEEEVHPDFNR